MELALVCEPQADLPFCQLISSAFYRHRCRLAVEKWGHGWALSCAVSPHAAAIAIRTADSF
jgi:hypothetical protein